MTMALKLVVREGLGLFTRLVNATIVIETTPFLINLRYITPDTRSIGTGSEC